VQPTLVTTDMRYWRIAADPRLRAHVSCYWVMDGARSSVPSEELMLPDGFSEIVFTRMSGGFERWKLGERERAQHMTRSYLLGGRSHTVGTRSDVALKLAGAKLDSRFLRAAIGTPLSEFRDSTVALADLGDRRLLELEDFIASSTTPETIAAALDRYFLGVLREYAPRRRASDALLRRIQIDHGTTSILRWARDARVDARHLERGFCAATGMTPKQFARVIRFKRAYRDLVARGRTAAAGTPLDGFYDQSHFNREFRYFTGVAPGVKLGGRMTQGTLVADHLLEVDA
jgi:AraC-like DNA-binding protein